ncbi:MAG: transglycosylase SLT domain-containing protein [Proteobacteria bacterium]|nr:transglycosylase SLT domain-containing protein [Pseudomonadota bacterium]
MKKIIILMQFFILVCFSPAFAVNNEDLTKVIKEDHSDKSEEVFTYDKMINFDNGISAKSYSEKEERKRDNLDIIVESIFWGVNSNPKVNHFVNYYREKARERFGIWLSRAGKYLPIISKIFEENGLAEELVFLPLIESGFSPYATSRAQAVGIWQFMKGTAKNYGLRVDKFIDERRDPEKSTIAAASYLKDLYERFGSWDFALAAYNAGEGKISRIQSSTGYKSFWDVISHRKVKRETREYVPRFVAATLIAKNPEEFGFENIQKDPVLEDTEKIMLPAKTTLKSIAEAIEVDEQTIKDLNPAIKNGFLPPDGPYLVRIPKDKTDLLLSKIDELKRADEKSIRKAFLKKEPRGRSYTKKSKRPAKKIADAKRANLS